MKNNGRKICAIVLAGALLVTSLAGAQDAQGAAKKTKIKNKKISVSVGKKKKIVLKGKKKGHKYTFTSKNKKIAKVSKKGVVTGVKSGKTTIIVKDVKKKKKTNIGKVRVVVTKGKTSNKENGVVNSQTPVPTTPGTDVPTASAKPTDAGQTTQAPKPTDGSQTTEAPKPTDGGQTTEAPKPTDGSQTTEAPKPTDGGQTTEAPKPTDGGQSTEAPKPTDGSQATETPKVFDKVDFTKAEDVEYDAATQSIHAKDIELFKIKLDYEIPKGKTASVKIKGKANGTVGFRSWLVDSGAATMSNQWSTADEKFTAPGEFEFEYDLTATNTAGYILFKGIQWGTNIDDLTLTSVEIVYPEKPVKIEPKDPYAPEVSQDANAETLTLTPTFSELKKGTIGNNPLFTQSFMADPTAVEYDGRLYIYGTHDIIEFDNKGMPVDNAYNTHEIHVISSADLVNWTDHGTIDVKAAAPWAKNSWAPSICKKEQKDGTTKFYLYFANGGNGIGVIEGDSPLGPWRAPTDKALISRDTPNCSNAEVPWLFDPAVLVDDDGSAYLYFGGGVETGKEANPKSARVVKLGEDMASLDGDPVELDPSYLFEDSEINKINGKYVYSYCANWSDGSSSKFGSKAAISYMISDSPMTGFEQKDTLFANPGTVFGNAYNNHHKIIEFKGEYYIIYHTTLLEKAAYDTSKGYRTIQMDKVTIKEENGEMTITATPTYEGVSNIAQMDPYAEVSATTMALNGGLQSVKSQSLDKMVVDSIHTGDWMGIRNVNFGTEGTQSLKMSIASETGAGSVDVYLDKASAAEGGKKIGSVSLVKTADGDTYQTVSCDLSEKITGEHDIYFVFRGEGYHVSSWQFVKAEA